MREPKSEEEAAIKLPPKLCVYNKIESLECKTEIEKSLCKRRWESQDYQERNGEFEQTVNNEILDNNHNQNKTTPTNPFENESDNEEERTEWPINRSTKTINLSILRPTDIPNKSITLPPPLKHEKETKLQQSKIASFLSFKELEAEKILNKVSFITLYYS